MSKSVTTGTLDETIADKVDAAVSEVVAAAGKKGQLTLSQCGKHDFSSPNYGKKFGWAAICADRHERGISRKQRRLKKKAEEAN